MKKYLVTGSTGFIGSAFIRHLANRHKADLEDWQIRALYRNSSQTNLQRLTSDGLVCNAISRGWIKLVNHDLTGDISGVCEDIDVVVNFAAKTFVDHSIKDPEPFIQSNIVGTSHLLEDARRYKVTRFIQVSTDEVYGQILTGAYTEDAPINPRNPYAASKAAADAMAISYAHTFGMHTTITRTENNYGPFQHPQKAFPTFVRKAIANESLPIYGDGQHVRQWLYVDDHVRGILHLLNRDYPAGEVFHVAGRQELTNIDLAKKILDAMGKPHSLIQFIDDHNIRPGHDRRYALNCDKLVATGWQPLTSLDEGIQKSVSWYVNNQWWLS